MNDSIRFPQFEGRSREEARLANTLRKVVGPVLDKPFPGWFDYLNKHYSTRVPYHSRVHVAYGLLWLVEHGASTDVVLAWLGHDSAHNGHSKQSPETTSADILRDAIGDDRLREIILHTIFPYVSSFDGAPQEWPQKAAETNEGGMIRQADTYRVYAGLTPNLGVDKATALDIYLMEVLGLHHELYLVDGTTTFCSWTQNGQTDFFPGQIDLGIDAGVFGEIDATEAHGNVDKVRIWHENVTGDDTKFAALRELQRFWLQDVTLTELAAKRIALGL